MTMPRGKHSKRRRSVRREHGVDLRGAGLALAADATPAAPSPDLDGLVGQIVDYADGAPVCATCGHMETAHSDEGACSMQGCDCGAYVAKEYDENTADADALAVSGDTGLPLSDRARAWDAAAARRRLAVKASSDGSGDKDKIDWAEYGRGFFWVDNTDRESFGGYKLPFADVIDGDLTAVWRGVTAGAQRLDATAIPAGDKTKVQGRMGGYYTKAAKQYDDPSIVPPWDTAALQDTVTYADTPDGFQVVGFQIGRDWRDGALDAAADILTVGAEDAFEHVRARLEFLANAEFVAAEAVEIVPPADGGVRTGLHWEAILAPEGTMTDDGRAFAPGSIDWRELPLTLMAMTETQPGHDGAEVAGRIDRIWRDETAGLIRAQGEFADTDYGRYIADLVDKKVLRGNSVDLAIHDAEYGPRSDWFDQDGNWAPKPQDERAAGDVPGPLESLLEEVDPNDPPIFVVTKAVIGMSTVCPFPAFAEATIETAPATAQVAAGSPFVWTVRQDGRWAVTGPPAVEADPFLDDLTKAMTERVTEWTVPNTAITLEMKPLVTASGLITLENPLTALVAAAPPTLPPAGWFTDPGLTEPTPLVVTDDGRVYGHAAPWGACHTGFKDVCVTAPHSRTGYRFFHLKAVECDDGTMADCGTITLEAPHANQRLNLVDATSHYDNTGMAVADVTVGEDEHGIWVAGALRPDTTPEVIRELRGAVLSGDWRDYEGNLELIGLLAVNVPGFPIPKVAARVAGGRTLALVAAGSDPERWAEMEPLPVADPAFEKLKAIAASDSLRALAEEA